MSSFLKRAEWALAILLSATALILLLVRFTHAGALWRDEVAVVNLARMPTIADIAHNFQHEAFPVPFPLLVRAYTNFFGTSDTALRTFGLLAGIGVIGGLWLSSFLVFRGVPLLSTALLGLNATFLVWGTTLRGYGLGSVLLILTFGMFAAVLAKLSPGRVALCALLAVAAAQCLVHNLVLICAIAGSAAIVCISRHDFRRLIVVLAIAAVCIASFLPYLNAYSSSWSQIVEFPVTLRLIWRQFNFALGNPNPSFAWLWHAAFIALLITGAFHLWRARTQPTHELVTLAFVFLCAIAAPIFYYEFLQTLSYLTRSWYFLALLSLLAIAIDCIAGLLKGNVFVRVTRIALGIVLLIVLPINVWPQLLERQTNIDTVAAHLTESARPGDLIVISPWQYAISLARYYPGPLKSVTLPNISDLRVHRYDLFREKMASSTPIQDVLDQVETTLKNGNRVWLVGGIKLPPAGESPRTLPPLPSGSGGADNVAYTEAWRIQLGAFLRGHGQHGQMVALPLPAPVNQFENVPLVMVEGWQ